MNYIAFWSHGVKVMEHWRGAGCIKFNNGVQPTSNSCRVSLSFGFSQEHRTKISQESASPGCSCCSQDLLIVVDVGLDFWDDVKHTSFAWQLAALGVHRCDVLQERHVPDEVIQTVHRIAAVALLQWPEGSGVVAVAAVATSELAKNSSLKINNHWFNRDNSTGSQLLQGK